MSQSKPLHDRAASPEAEGIDELAGLRDEIDGVDRQILDLLNQRARCVQQVGAVKAGGRNGPVYVAARERDLVRTLLEANDGPFPGAGIPHVFREIISATRSLEERVRVAFLGPDGTFSHQAASRQFGAQVDLVPVTKHARRVHADRTWGYPFRCGPGGEYDRRDRSP